ncbi:hypothetical protein IL306_005642, partial [Fusarium sp. DS 682]
AQNRDKHNPKMNKDDAIEVLKYFDLDNNRKEKKKKQQVSVPCENTASSVIFNEDSRPSKASPAVSEPSKAPSSPVASEYTQASSTVSRASSVTTVTPDTPATTTRGEPSCPTIQDGPVDDRMEEDSLFVERVSDFPNYRRSATRQEEDCKPKTSPMPEPESMDSEPSEPSGPSHEHSETVERTEAHIRESVESEMQIDTDVSVHKAVQTEPESNSSSVTIYTFLIPLFEHVLIHLDSHNLLLKALLLLMISSKS